MESRRRGWGKDHTWELYRSVAQSPGVTEIGLEEVDVGLTHHNLLAIDLVVHHFHHQRQCMGLFHRHELQPKERGT